jgi:hypothetical protein
MEPMRVIVQKILRQRQDLLVAEVRAVSQEQISGAPRATIRMRIRLEDPGPGAGLRELRRLARDEALRFLDVS